MPMSELDDGRIFLASGTQPKCCAVCVRHSPPFVDLSVRSPLSDGARAVAICPEIFLAFVDPPSPF